MERINKYLSSLGVASRRRVDQMVTQGRVRVNGQPAALGQKVSPLTDTITIDGRPVDKTSPVLTYLALHKPLGVISTAKDERGRPSVLDLVNTSSRLYPVGRLDLNSTGLILLTNDGSLALKLTHPRFHLPKTYLVTVEGGVSPSQITRLTNGVVLEDGKTLPAVVQIFHKTLLHTDLKFILKQGKKRQIRRMCAAVGLNITKLHRISIGPICLGKLPEGTWRHLTPSEITRLKNL